MTNNYSLSSSFCVVLMLQMMMSSTIAYYHHLPLHVALTLQMRRSSCTVCHCLPLRVAIENNEGCAPSLSSSFCYWSTLNDDDEHFCHHLTCCHFLFPIALFQK